MAAAAIMNRGKRSIALNLASEDGRAVLMKLVDGADVFLQNWRPGVAKKLGVDGEDSQRNKRLIYECAPGCGQSASKMDRKVQRPPSLPPAEHTHLSSERRDDADVVRRDPELAGVEEGFDEAHNALALGGVVERRR